MSYIFDVRDETVWSPALRVGEAYVGFARHLGAVFGTDTGLDEVASDMVDIDVDRFERFVQVLLGEHLRSGHPILRALLEGTLLVSLALLVRAGRPLEPRTEDERDLDGRAREYAARMAA